MCVCVCAEFGPGEVRVQHSVRFCCFLEDVSFESFSSQRLVQLSPPELQRIIIYCCTSLRLIHLFRGLSFSPLSLSFSFVLFLLVHSGSAHLLAAHEFLMSLPSSCAVSTECCCCVRNRELSFSFLLLFKLKFNFKCSYCLISLRHRNTLKLTVCSLENASIFLTLILMNFFVNMRIAECVSCLLQCTDSSRLHGDAIHCPAAIFSWLTFKFRQNQSCNAELWLHHWGRVWSTCLHSLAVSSSSSSGLFRIESDYWIKQWWVE